MPGITPSFDLRGFADPVADAQLVFRALLTAMSLPGTIAALPVEIDGNLLPPAVAAVALTLLDYETPVLLQGRFASDEIARYLAFHTGAPIAANPEAASFVIASDLDVASWSALPIGTPEYPDRSATILLPVSTFETGVEVQLTGPGLSAPCMFRASTLTSEFWTFASANSARFPLGLDFVFCGEEGLAALPRSCTVTVQG